MRKPQSIPSDKNRRRLVTEPFTVTWTVDGQPHRMTIKPWGASYEPSIPKLNPALNAAIMVAGVLVWAHLLIGVPAAAYYPLMSTIVFVAVWAVIMLPAALMGVLAPREALSPVSAAHDYIYRNRGKVEYRVLENGLWKRRKGMTRRQADAVMRADPDDPTWLQWAAWAYTRILGWWPWDGWDEWLSQKMPW